MFAIQLQHVRAVIVYIGTLSVVQTFLLQLANLRLTKLMTMALLGKILDHIIIEKQSEALKTCNYQFGFKGKSSTVLCNTMVNETVQYYTENGGKPVYLHVLLLDASNALDKVAFNVLFNKLRDRFMCPRITKLLHHVYTNQYCYVKWGNEHSDSFNVSISVKQGGVICLVVILINFFHN